MTALDADYLCARINDRQTSLPFTYGEGDSEHLLAIGGRPPIRFPRSAGGGVHGGSASWIEKVHQHGAIHEPGLIAALMVLTEEQPSIRTILDIGALYGYVSFVARSLFETAEVHAFEVNPRSYEALVNNIEANRPTFGDSVHAHHCALSDVSEQRAALRIYRMRVEALDSGKNVSDEGRDEHIDVWTLDAFCREQELAPDLIKLDVEGYQAKIIPGGLDVIFRTRPVILMEFDLPGRAANDFGLTNREVIRPLMDEGYRLIWGKHRYPHVPFRVLAYGDLTDEHEQNSLGILLP